MKTFLKTTTGIAIILIFIWLLFHDTDWKIISRSLMNVDLKYVLLSQFFAWGGYFLRIKRWEYIVKSSHPSSFRSMFSSTQIGFLVNFIIPARIGEALRAYLFSRFTNVPFLNSLTLVALDRMTDLFGLSAICMIVFIFFPVHREIHFEAGALFNREAFTISTSFLKPVFKSMVGFLIIILIVVLFIYLKRDIILQLSKTWGKKISKKTGEKFQKVSANILQGISIFGSGPDFFKSLLFTLLLWGSMVVSITFLLCAFHILFPWYIPFFLIVMIALFISVPVTPGVIGQYHISVIAGLMIGLPDMNLNIAKGFSLVAHVANLLPIAGLGIFCLYRERLNLFTLVKEKRAQTE